MHIVYNIKYTLNKGGNMEQINLKAMAKINITIDVLGKREDGYHDVQMIMQTVNLYDKIYIKKNNTKEIVLKTNLKWLPTDEKNLVYKAAKIIMDNYNVDKGVEIKLDKIIPVCAGLAGGSSDAAATLVGMNKLFNLNIKKEELKKLGQTLGADVPYCIMRGTALAEGIGEKITRLPNMPKCYVVLAKPSVKIKTSWVYENLNLRNIKEHPDTKDVLKSLEEKDLRKIANGMCNVLESITEYEYPVISTLKKFMINKGALNAMMSGSGPTVFGIFEDFEKAKIVGEELRRKYKMKNVFVNEIYNNYKKEGKGKNARG